MGHVCHANALLPMLTLNQKHTDAEISYSYFSAIYKQNLLFERLPSIDTLTLLSTFANVDNQRKYAAYIVLLFNQGH